MTGAYLDVADLANAESGTRASLALNRLDFGFLGGQ